MSLAKLDRSLEIAPGYLDTKLIKAELYAVYQDDEALFRQLLGEVIASADDVVPELVAENKNAKRRAQQMLDNIEDYF